MREPEEKPAGMKRWKPWQVVTVVAGFIGASWLLPTLGLLFLDNRHLAAAEKETILLFVAQSTQSIQAGVNANQLQLMQWELNDINARIGTKDERPGDKSRKLVLESRIKDLAKK